MHDPDKPVTDYRIEIIVDAKSRDEAIAAFEALVSEVRGDQYPECTTGGGGAGSVGFWTKVGWKHLTLEERVARLEAITNTKGDQS